MTHWRNSALFLVFFAAACDGGIDGPSFDDDQTDEDQTDQDNVDLTDQDQQGGDSVLPGDLDGDGGGDGGGDTGGGDAAGGDSVGGGDDVPPTDDGPPVTPVATDLVAISSTAQSALAGTAVLQAPEVEVRDQLGAPMEGVVVHFEVTVGGGVIVPTTNITTGTNGRAKLTSWTLGKTAFLDRPDRVVASVPAAPALGTETFSATVTTGYRIQVIFLDTMTPSQEAAFTDAAARWSAVITNDLQDASITPQEIPVGSLCGAAHVDGDDNPIDADDLVIFARVGTIDGPLNTLAEAGPCFTRGSGPDIDSPAFGIMNFDSEDIASLEADEVFDDTILHEMGHVIGIGTFWDSLVQNPSFGQPPGQNTVFVGSSAATAFTTIGGTGFPGAVPVDNTGVAGSADAHWREDVFTVELMTPQLSVGLTTLPMSIVTIASLEDIGFYVVNPAAADAFSLAPGLRVAADHNARGYCVPLYGATRLPAR